MLNCIRILGQQYSQNRKVGYRFTDQICHLG